MAADLATGQAGAADTFFRAQSISKSVTAWGVMKLVDQGRITLGDPVGHHITRWRLPDPATREVTVRQLLSHTAGMTVGALDLEYSPAEDVPSPGFRLQPFRRPFTAVLDTDPTHSSAPVLVALLYIVHVVGLLAVLVRSSPLASGMVHLHARVNR